MYLHTSRFFPDRCTILCLAIIGEDLTSFQRASYTYKYEPAVRAQGFRLILRTFSCDSILPDT